MTSLSAIKYFKLTADKFLKTIVEFYYRNMEKATPEALCSIKSFIDLLPSLHSIRKLLLMQIITQKELLPLKFILDIYENYYKKYDLPCYKNLINEYITTSKLFYSNCTNEDCKSLYEKITSSKDLNEILVYKLKISLYKKKTEYVNYLDNLNKNYSKLIGGLDYKKFCR